MSCAWPRFIPQRSRSFIKVKSWILTISCWLIHFIFLYQLTYYFENYDKFHKLMCCGHEPGLYVKGQGHSLRSKFENWLFPSAYYFIISDGLTYFFCNYVQFHKVMCWGHDPGPYLRIQGHSLRSKFENLWFLVLLIVVP
jgi:hypothetical protein